MNPVSINNTVRPVNSGTMFFGSNCMKKKRRCCMKKAAKKSITALIIITYPSKYVLLIFELMNMFSSIFTHNHPITIIQPHRCQFTHFIL